VDLGNIELFFSLYIIQIVHAFPISLLRDIAKSTGHPSAAWPPHPASTVVLQRSALRLHAHREELKHRPPDRHGEDLREYGEWTQCRGVMLERNSECVVDTRLLCVTVLRLQSMQYPDFVVSQVGPIRWRDDAISVEVVVCASAVLKARDVVDLMYGVVEVSRCTWSGSWEI